ncbi:TolB family protein [Phytohabitans aurantiacus]|uniref:Lipoprotein LpqB beta-propeller domain-containing protein n=1 Tax=Phytohabitans aurantiacus TaxID=3016789 RepID=A0ABQ5QSS3_9ACTN|nr:hypothetical protein [Phytohabitans aurantiacus]GLH96651.1 hypothetical protein Pa4123_19250 [Phytohabitans aurantiacus]
MSGRLAQVLAETAEQAPPVPSPDDLWRRGRHRRRRRQTAAALACLLLVAALAWSPVRSRTALEFAGPGADVLPSEVLPSEVAEPHLWQRTFHGDPNGPVKLTFTTGHSLNLETALVLIGDDGSYRLDYLSPGEEPGVLSPNGRWLLGQNMTDLTTGDTRKLDRALSGITPAVWAPDSRTAVGVIGDDTGTSYGPDGQEIDGPAPEIVLVDVASGFTRTILRSPDTSRWRAAFSPDGGRLAVFSAAPGHAPRVLIIDTHGGEQPREITLTDRQQLAGPAAWTPDGSRILLTAGDTCAWADLCQEQTWHPQRLDAATGTIADDTARGLRGYPTVVAWRDGEPIAQQTRDGHDGCETVTVTATGARTLPLAVAGGGCADYARDLLETGALGGPGIGPSPWQAQWWAYLPAAVLLLVLVQVVRVIVRRRTQVGVPGMPPANGRPEPAGSPESEA